MKTKSSFKTSTVRIFALSACMIAAAMGCDPEESDEFGGTVGGANASPGGGTTGGGAPGGGGTTGGGVAAGGATTGGGTAAGGATTGGGAATGGGATTGGGVTGGGSTDTPWCKAKAVFDARCIACHDGNKTAGAPMALKSFEDLTADSAQYPGTKIFTRSVTRMKATTAMMPPQGGLTAAEIQAVDAWIQGGAQAGSNPTCAGASTGGGTGGTAPAWPTDCDGTYKILAHDTADPSKPYRMPQGTEAHPGYVFDAPWGSDEVQGLAFRPVTDNSKVLHHWILYQNGGTRAFLTGWAPGQDAAKKALPSDVGMYLPSGPKSLYLDMHYNSLQADKEELDQSGVEICVVKKPKFRPNTASVYMGFVGIGFPMAPANTSNHNLTANCTVTAAQPVHLLTASPHAHKLATHMKFTAKVGGKEVVMHDEPFDFEEQVSHPLTPEVVLNTGDTVTTTCTFTNPTNRDVQFSENTDGEMCFNFAVYYPRGALSCGGGGFGGLFGGGGSGGTGAGGFLGGIL